MTIRIINPSQVRDISKLLLDDSGCLRVVPASTLLDTTLEERALFGARNGYYSFPTEELVSFLADRLVGRTGIEIGSGHGVLAKALGIPATDNRQQERPEIRAHYELLRQPIVPYGKHVEKLDALDAVVKYKPQVVIACWVTHRYDPQRHEAEGSVFGVSEEDIIANCDEYIVVGNEKVHEGKSIWALPHEKLTPPWLFSRAANGSKDFIAIWSK